MSTLGSKLITKQMEWNANMTEQNHLGKALLIKPDKMMGKMNMLFSAKNYYSDNPISSMLMGNKMTEEECNADHWEWELKGANARPAVIMENVLSSTNVTPGKYKRTFKLKLDVNWFVEGDIISPGGSDKKYQCRIQKPVQRHGEGYIYEVIQMTNDDQQFVPIRHLSSGVKWGKLYSQYEEAAEQSGSTQYSLPIALSNKMGLFRKKYKITNFAANTVLAVKVPGSDGQMHDSWMKYAEAELWMQWYRELERGYIYSRSTDTVLGANGRPVKSGPGLQEQLEDSHRHVYTHLTTRLIEEYLMDIFYSRVKPGKGRHVKGYTGEYGMLQFHRAVESWMTKSGFVTNVEVFTDKVKSDIHGNALEGGYQFVRYRMANGSTLELVHNPLYDDRNINFEIDPVSGFPVESQRITFLDFNGDAGQSNLMLKNKKDGFAHTYVEGMYGPYGPKKGGSSAHSGSYYEMHVEKTCGLHVHDITRCGELILGRN